MAAEQARAVIDEFLQRVNKTREDLGPETSLFGGGLELDSLEAAELSVMLEDAFGTDAFSAGDQVPQTVGEILAFYEVSSSA